MSCAKRQKFYVVTLTTKEDSEINTVIGWFNLHLKGEVINGPQ